MMDEETLLKKAIDSMLRGQLLKSKSFLKKIRYSTFDFNEFVTESNLMLCGLYEEFQVTGTVGQQHVEKFEKLITKVIGLQTCNLLLHKELTICYNYSWILFTNQQRSVNKSDLLEQHINRSILRVAQLYNIQHDRDTFHWSSNRIPYIIQYLSRHNTSSLSSVLGMYTILALHWLIDGRTDDALKLVNQVLNSLELFKTVDIGVQNTVFMLRCGTQPISIDPQNTATTGHYFEDVLKFIKISCCYVKRDYKECMSCQLQQTDALWVMAKYITGYLYYQLNYYVKSLEILQNIGSHVTPYEPMILNLKGCCLAKQKKPQTAIHCYSKVLEKDFRYVISLYNIALQYHTLQLYEAELETWNLLITTMQTKDFQTNLNKNHLVMTIDNHEVPDYSHRSVALSKCTNKLSLISVLHIMAKRCLELERYEVAAQKYIDLLGMIVDSTIMQGGDISASMPDFTTVYSEATAALLMAQRYEDVCLVAQELITKSTSSDSNGKLLIINQSMSVSVSFIDETFNVSKSTLHDETFDEPQESTSRKRLRSDDAGLCLSGQTTDEEKLLHVAMVLMMQAESLVETDQCSDALRCLDHVCQLLGDVMPILDGEEKGDDGVGLKRRRINTDGELATIVNNNKMHKRLLEIKSDAYNNKAMVLIGLNKQHEALQMLLLSIHCYADNSNAVYNHTLLLFDMKRQQEAANNWLQYRRIDSKMDSMQISHLLRKKLAFLRTHVSEPTGEYQLVKMDQVTLEWWMKYKHHIQ